MYDIKEKKKYPTLHIYLTNDIRDRLMNYVKQKYGSHRAISLTVQQAIREFLQRQDF